MRALTGYVIWLNCLVKHKIVVRFKGVKYIVVLSAGDPDVKSDSMMINAYVDAMIFSKTTELTDQCRCG
jgi:hypothetical protein